MRPPARPRHDVVAALSGVHDRLRSGVRVVDVRCGDGAALVSLAVAFPRSTYHGFDADPAVVAAARRAAAAAGVSDRVTFEVAARGTIPGGAYDVVLDGERLREVTPGGRATTRGVAAP